MTHLEAPSDVLVCDVYPLAQAQRRILSVLFSSQVLGGIGVGTGVSVGSIIAAKIGHTDSVAGLAQTSSALGGAIAAVPLTRLMLVHGRRPGLATGYLVGAAGCGLVVAATVTHWFGFVICGMVLFGWANTANLQARYAAADCAAPDRRARAISTIVWATTVGAVLGPNLTGLGGWVGRNVGVPELAGPFVISIAAFCLAALSVGVRLRPDPLVLAREAAATDRRGVGSSDAAPRPGLGEITRALRGRPVVLSALLSLWVSQAVMVALMSMTPIEMTQDGEGLSVIGLVISVHIAGMYAFSPVVGWFSQRVGQGIGLVVGHLLLLGAALVTGIANGMGHTSMLVGLFMLGLGWSCCLIVSSTLLTEGVPERLRPTTQGFADVALGLSGAAGGAIAGVVIDVAGFRALASCVAVLVLVSLLFASLAQGAQRIRATSAALSSESQGELA